MPKFTPANGAKSRRTRELRTLPWKGPHTGLYRLSPVNRYASRSVHPFIPRSCGAAITNNDNDAPIPKRFSTAADAMKESVNTPFTKASSPQRPRAASA